MGALLLRLEEATHAFRLHHAVHRRGPEIEKHICASAHLPKNRSRLNFRFSEHTSRFGSLVQNRIPSAHTFLNYSHVHVIIDAKSHLVFRGFVSSKSCLAVVSTWPSTRPAQYSTFQHSSPCSTHGVRRPHCFPPHHTAPTRVEVIPASGLSQHSMPIPFCTLGWHLTLVLLVVSSENPNPYKLGFPVVTGLSQHVGCVPIFLSPHFRFGDAPSELSALRSAFFGTNSENRLLLPHSS